MINFSLVIISSFILIYQNIIILNEETLILICFITFCFLVYNKLNKSVYDDFKQKSNFLKNSIEDSLNSLLKKLIIDIKTQNKSKNFSTDFKNLGDHLLRLSFSLSNKFPLWFIKNREKTYPKKLFFANRLEEQTTKLLALLLSHKLTKIAFLQRFYIHEFKITPILCVNKVMLREYLEII
uniref:ATP synthase F0 subunit b n=1 Tax=Eucheuma denticulatum TaxID=305493 RepID=A0A2H4QI67_9FLOR|nr:ATP synthase F0 subunit b [Eucheuma denticulatum]ATX68867.1 ATP synthase F0 subunit b [Eucheuma denticulatum]